jgi:hypothetical protein
MGGWVYSEDIAQSMAELEEDFASISVWASLNCMKLNAEKTKFMPLCRNAAFDAKLQSLSLSVGGGAIVRPVQSLRILGVEFDAHLKFDKHVALTRGKCSRFLSVLRRSRQALPRRMLVMLINAYVISSLLYCITAIGIKAEVLSNLQLLQNYAVRCIFGLPKFAHVSRLRRELQWRSMATLYKYRLSILAYKSIHGLTAAYLNPKIAERVPSHQHGLRYQVLRNDVPINAWASQTFICQAIKLYNEYSGAVFAKSISEFQRTILNMLPD